MAKMSIKDLLLQKGEKIGLIVAGLGMAGMIGLGVSNALSGEDPQKFAGGIKAKADQIKMQMQSPEATVDPLPSWVNKPYNAKADISLDQFAARNPIFDPISIPSSRRSNPLVVGVTEIQAEPFWAKIDSWDIIAADPRNPVIGVKSALNVGDGKAVADPFRNIQRRTIYDPNLQQRLQNGGGGMAPGMPPGGGMAPGGMGGGPGGGGGGGRGGGRGPGSSSGAQVGGGGMGGAGLPAGGRPSGMSSDSSLGTLEGKKEAVVYVPLNDPEALKGKVPVHTIYPQRMIIVTASFPYKLELERIREALRLNTIQDIYSTEGATPSFTGFNVQRQVLLKDGKTVETPWEDYLTEVEYRKNLFRRSAHTYVDDPKLNFVKLDFSNKLWFPLPGLMRGGKYPDVKLPSLLATIQRFQAMNQPPAIPRNLDQRLGEGDIFAPSSGSPADNQQPTAPGGMPNMGGTIQNNLEKGEAPDSVLVRFIDPDVVPGYKYQYRIQIKMKNPNFGKGNLLSRPSDGDIPELLGEWVAMKDSVGIPPETYIYAIDSVPGRPEPKDGQAYLQYQRWLPQISLSTTFIEPIADWVVSEIPIMRGVFVGGKQLTNVPVWSAERDRFEIKITDTNPRAPRKDKGIYVDPTAELPEKFLVVDIEGGRRKHDYITFDPSTKNISSSKQVIDEASTEVLLMDAVSGRLVVLISTSEESNKERFVREERWRKWQLEVEAGMRGGNDTPNPGPGGTPNRFGDGR